MGRYLLARGTEEMVVEIVQLEKIHSPQKDAIPELPEGREVSVLSHRSIDRLTEYLATLVVNDVILKTDETRQIISDQSVENCDVDIVVEESSGTPAKATLGDFMTSAKQGRRRRKKIMIVKSFSLESMRV